MNTNFEQIRSGRDVHDFGVLAQFEKDGFFELSENPDALQHVQSIGWHSFIAQDVFL